MNFFIKTAEQKTCDDTFICSYESFLAQLLGIILHSTNLWSNPDSYSPVIPSTSALISDGNLLHSCSFSVGLVRSEGAYLL